MNSSEVVFDMTQEMKTKAPSKKTKPPFKKKPRYFDESTIEKKPQLKYLKDGKRRDWKLHKLDKSEKKRKLKRSKKPDKPQKMEEEEEDIKSLREVHDPFPGSKPIPEEKIKKYSRGDTMETTAKTGFHSKVLDRKKKKESLAAQQAARAELLHIEETGFLEADEGESTTTITQHQLVKSVDVTSATKHFDLVLKEFGPYRMDYTRNGRFLVLGGGKGHIAAMDWMTKKLMCEVNVMERINDVQWLHQETMFAVAQKKWTYIYDNQGLELHCLKMLDQIQRMEFLPYHFLLAAASSSGFLQYIDVSIGQKVSAYNTGKGRLDVMCQNPGNAVIAMGHNAGVVTMWTPKIKSPIMKMLTHKAAVRSIAIDKTGTYMATSGIDRYIKIWDLRTYKLLQSYKVSAGAGSLSFSQRGLLAAATENLVEVYKDCCQNTVTSPYMVHRVGSTVNNVQFCPFEDVLGVGHYNGFQSLLIPGAGEANFDALELNPYQSKNHRQQAEVKMLLEKIPAELIHIDTNVIGKVGKKSAQEIMEQEAKLKMGKIDKIDFQPKFKQRGKSKGEKMIKRQKKMEELHKREVFKETLHKKQTEDREKKVEEKRKSGPGSVLDRFKKKDD